MARRILDSIMYMTLATADEQGRPWASPDLVRAPIVHTSGCLLSFQEAGYALGDRSAGSG
jgi:hypothetical protein